MKPLTLMAKRVKETQGTFKTELYLNGKLLCVFPFYAKQPSKNRKYIEVNCFKYKLQFNN